MKAIYSNGLAALVVVAGLACKGGVGVSLDIEGIEPKHPSRFGESALTVYSVKFLCGTIQSTSGNPQFPAAGDLLVPGTYLTAINIHNPNNFAIDFRKKALITNPQGQPRGKVGNFERETLGPNEGLEVDCRNISALLGGGPALQTDFVKGFVEIVTPADSLAIELNVVGVYTLKNVE